LKHLCRIGKKTLKHIQHALQDGHTYKNVKYIMQDWYTASSVAFLDTREKWHIYNSGEQNRHKHTPAYIHTYICRYKNYTFKVLYTQFKKCINLPHPNL